MKIYTFFLPVFCSVVLVACSSSGGSGGNNGDTSNGGTEGGIELVSTTSLESSGVNVEIPTLTAKSTINVVNQGVVGLSPNGRELAIAKSYPLDANFETGYETTVSIFDTDTGILQREFTESFEGEGLTDNRMGGGFSRPSLVMWSNDDTLTVLFGGVMAGYSFQAKTGEVLAKQLDTQANICRARAENINTFNPRNNTFFCIGFSPDSRLVAVDTRSLTHTATTPIETDELLVELSMSHSGDELVLMYEGASCVICRVATAYFISANSLQQTRDSTTATRYAALGNGFSLVDINFESFLVTATRSIPLDGSVDVSADTNLTKSIIAIDRGYYSPNLGAGSGFRLLRLPNGRVIGDISHRGSSGPERMLFSTDGSIAAHVADLTVDIYTTEPNTIYTALQE